MNKVLLGSRKEVTVEGSGSWLYGATSDGDCWNAGISRLKRDNKGEESLPGS